MLSLLLTTTTFFYFLFFDIPFWKGKAKKCLNIPILVSNIYKGYENLFRFA